MSTLYKGVRYKLGIVSQGHPVYNGHPYITDSFVCPDEKLDHMFSLKFTRLIGTPVDTDNTNNGHFCVS